MSWFKKNNTNLNAMNEPQPLPQGMTEFEAWADRIISGARLTAREDSQKFALAEMILHLGPTESHKPDAYFIHSLRKSAANQIAHAKMMEIRDQAKARLAEEEAAVKAKQEASKLSVVPSEATQNTSSVASEEKSSS